MTVKWLEWAKQIQALSQAGLAYSKDDFDIERFQALRNISVEMVSELSGVPAQKIENIFAGESGYQTPKVDVRAVIFQDKQLLLVKEKHDHKWALPGGWADVGFSAGEIAIKEVREETGFNVVTERLLALLDKKFHSHPPSLYHVYKIFVLCRIVSGEATTGIETSEVAFFTEENLPPLSTARNTEEQIHLMFQFLTNPYKQTVFD